MLLLYHRKILSNSLRPHGLQHDRPPRRSLSPEVCSHSILCLPLLLLPSVFPSTRVFSNESALCIRWPKYWSFSISPSYEYSRLISFRIDWFDLLAVQGTLKNLLQHHNCKASILWCSVFFMVQLSHLSMTIGKIITLNIGISVEKMISLLFDYVVYVCHSFSSKEQAYFFSVKKILSKRKPE